MFVGSPIKHSEDELLALGKKLKRNSIAIDIISYGPTELNNDKIEKFINAVNNNNNSSMVSVAPGFVIVDALFSSSLMGVEQQPDQIMNDNIGGGGHSGGNVMPQLSQFDRDMQKAFELSRAEEEEKKKKDVDKKTTTDNTGPEHDKVMTEKKGVDEEELTEEQLLTMAMEMSKVEHNKQSDEVKKKEGNKRMNITLLIILFTLLNTI